MLYRQNLFLQLEGARDDKCHVITNKRHVLLDAKITPADYAGRFKTNRLGFVERVDPGPDKTDFKRHRFCHAVKREIPSDRCAPGARRDD